MLDLEFWNFKLIFSRISFFIRCDIFSENMVNFLRLKYVSLGFNMHYRLHF